MKIAFDALAAKKTASWLKWYLGTSIDADPSLNLETRLIEVKIPDAIRHLMAALAEIERLKALAPPAPPSPPS